MAQWADMMFALVRTSDAGRQQQGLSLLLIDMTAPGVTVRPIPTIDGRMHVNDVFLDDVRVPVQNLIGSEGDGWACTKFIVNNERVLVTELGKSRRYFEACRTWQSTHDSRGRPLRASAGFRRRLVELELKVECLRALALAAMSALEAGTQSAIDASVLKIRGSQTQQALLEAMVEALTTRGLPAPSAGEGDDHTLVGGLLAEHFYARASSIYGGSNEIQANIIARAMLRQ